MKRALLSVSDKRGIVDLGRALADRGWALVSTGGTARTLREAGMEVTSVSEVTGHPEMMDGRVKTLHPAIHAGLLARRDRADDLAALEARGYGPIDLVAVNLYPFRERVTDPSVPMAEAMEVVDIGGPTMIRGAAKNHAGVWVVVDPDDYEVVVRAIDAAGDGGAGTEAERTLRRHLASKVFRHVAVYDAAIADYLEGGAPGVATAGADSGEGPELLPERLAVHYDRVQVLRYGENPDQRAAFYATSERAGLAALVQHHGKELSYNNLLDVDGALLSLSPFAASAAPVVCIVKHTTPCGLGVGAILADAYAKALATDPTSAFGSVIATNTRLDAATAGLMSELFVECVVAPGYDAEALDTLARKKNVRLLSYSNGSGAGVTSAVGFLQAHARGASARQLRSVYGGLLAQSAPVPPSYGGPDDASLKVVSARAPTAREWDDLRFAWAAIFGVKSNAILIARDGGVLGIGAGQMSRVDSSRIAVMKAREAGFDLRGSALASDAFFPFRDGVDAAAEAGVVAVIQPGGSMRDPEVVAAADEHGMAMVFTGRRLFRH